MSSKSSEIETLLIELRDLILNCVDLYFLPCPNLPQYVPHDAEADPWPPKESTIRKWLLETPLENIEIKGPLPGPQEVRRETKHLKKVPLELIKEAITRLGEIKDIQTVLKQHKQYYTLFDELGKRLQNLRKKLSEVTKGSFGEPYTFTVPGAPNAYSTEDILFVLVGLKYEEKDFEKDHKGFASFKDFMRDKLRRQRERYLRRWGGEFQKATEEKDTKYFIKDILNSTGIKKTLFYDLRKKKLIPQHYAKWGNSPYWLKEGYQNACETIRNHLQKKKN